MIDDMDDGTTNFTIGIAHENDATLETILEVDFDSDAESLFTDSEDDYASESSSQDNSELSEQDEDMVDVDEATALEQDCIEPPTLPDGVMTLEPFDVVEFSRGMERFRQEQHQRYLQSQEKRRQEALAREKARKKGRKRRVAFKGEDNDRDSDGDFNPEEDDYQEENDPQEEDEEMSDVGEATPRFDQTGQLDLERSTLGQRRSVLAPEGGKRSEDHLERQLQDGSSDSEPGQAVGSKKKRGRPTGSTNKGPFRYTQGEFPGNYARVKQDQSSKRGTRRATDDDRPSFVAEGWTEKRCKDLIKQTRKMDSTLADIAEAICFPPTARRGWVTDQHLRRTFGDHFTSRGMVKAGSPYKKINPEEHGIPQLWWSVHHENSQA